jgi:hypothetical protein
MELQVFQIFMLLEYSRLTPNFELAYTLEEADSKNFRMLFKTTFDKITAMHSRLYLHIAYHFVEFIEKGFPAGIFTCQKQERGNRVCKLGVHNHTNKRVPQIAEEIHRIALGFAEENGEMPPQLANLGKHYVEQFVTWYNRKLFTTRKYLCIGTKGNKRKRSNDDEPEISNKKQRTLRKRRDHLRFSSSYPNSIDEIIHKLSTSNAPSSTTDSMNIDNESPVGIRTDVDESVPTITGSSNEPSSTTDSMNIDNESPVDIRTDEEIHAYNLFDIQIQDRGSVNFE